MIIMNDLAVQIIMDCLEENLIEPNRNWPWDIFDERSYARWAAYEIANRLMDRPYETPDAVIAEFMYKMTALISCTEDPQKIRIFTVARDTAEDMLTLF